MTIYYSKKSNIRGNLCHALSRIYLDLTLRKESSLLLSFGGINSLKMKEEMKVYFPVFSFQFLPSNERHKHYNFVHSFHLSNLHSVFQKEAKMKFWLRALKQILVSLLIIICREYKTMRVKSYMPEIRQYRCSSWERIPQRKAI